MKNNWKPIEDRVKYEIELDLNPGKIIISSVWEECFDENMQFFFAELELFSQKYDLNNFEDFDSLENIKNYIDQNMDTIVIIRDKLKEGLGLIENLER